MIALTGPTGFLGQALLLFARQRSTELIPLIRTAKTMPQPQVSACAPRVIGDIGDTPVNPAALAGCSALIHCAARAHRMGELGSEALAAYRQTNVAGTKAIIDAMSRAGVRRLVYVSSIKALGERSDSIALKPSDPKRPEDPYGISKAEAEDAVLAAHAVGQIDAVIVRPVLVHGPGAKGNLERLLGALARGRPLPLGAVRNRRSMVGVGNLADALLTAAMAPLGKTDESQSTPGRTEVHPPSRLKSAPPVYHIADDGVISTRRLVEVLAEGLGVRPRLVSVPRWLAVGGATLLGKGAMARRLFDDLEVDDSDFRLDFAWRPAIDLEDGLRLMAEDFARRQRDGSAT